MVHAIATPLFGTEGVFGGAERYALELSRKMAERTRTTLICFGGRPSLRREDSLEIRVLRNWTNFRRFRFDPINPTLLRHLAKADIIHFHQTYTMMSSLAVLYAHFGQRPIFTTDLGSGGICIHRRLDIEHWYAGHLHISEFSKQSAGHESLANARVIGGGVDTARYSPAPLTTRTGEVVFAGRLLPHKGINFLIEAVDDTTPLTIIGRRYVHAQQFYDLLLTLSKDKRVRIEQDSDDRMLIDAYRRALCVVLPSVHDPVTGGHHRIPELLGLTLLEAMSCGTPVIGTNICSLPEVIVDGETGFLVPPNDPAALRDRIRWFQANPKEAELMGQAARARVLERFCWDRVVDNCLSAYAEASL